MLWFRALRERGVESRLLSFPDDAHPLASTACAADSFVNIGLWLAQTLGL